jgi:hypothetical protein
VVQSIVVLSEQALAPADAERLVALHDPERPAFRVLVPTGSRRHVITTVLDRLSLLEPKEAVEAVEGHPEPNRAQAADDVEASVATLRDLGVQVSGEVVDGDDPLEAVEAAVRGGAEELIVVTTPHAVEDTLHQNWATEARKRLGIPVLHLYAGSSWVGP